MDSADQIAAQIEKLLGDPIADAVPGVVRIISASEPVGRARYQECQLEVVTEAAGVEPTAVTTTVVTARKYWPKVGAALPAQISRSQPHRVEIDWDALAR